MTTAQIIIISLLLIADFWISIIHSIYKLDRPDLVLCHFIRMMFTYGIMISIFIVSNTNYDRAKGKCPEYEMVDEKFYKLKR